MTLAACINHAPVHVYGTGWQCHKCGVSLYFTTPALDLGEAVAVANAQDAAAWSRMQCEKLTQTILPETQQALDDIDANIRAAHIAAKTTYLD